MTGINVVSRSQKIFVEPASSAVAIVNAGPAGVSAPPAATPWTNANFQNAWVNVGGYQPMQYRKLMDMVQLRGTITGATAGVAFTLPAGFRPVTAQEFGLIVIDTNGTVTMGTSGKNDVNVQFYTN
ncbi:MAG: hypothetical protein ABWY25_09060 [Paenisporosarcina sp.]